MNKNVTLSKIEKEIRERYFFNMDLGSTFKKLLKDRSITQEQIALDLEISRKTINRILNNKSKGSLLILCLICLYLKLGPPLSNHIISISGFKFQNNEIDIVLETLINSNLQLEIIEVKEIIFEKTGLYV